MTESQKKMEENIEAHKAENRKLCGRMPYLAIHNAWTGEVIEDYDYSWTYAEELPRGWRKFFLQMCEDIREPLEKAGLLNEFYFMEVKEKYNTLRAYHSGATEEVNHIIVMYEYVSQFVCQDCGAPATKETAGWITGYCNDCFRYRVKEDASYRDVKFEPNMVIEMWENGEHYEITYDCSDIWERLYKE